MRVTLGKDGLFALVTRQVRNLFLLNSTEEKTLSAAIEAALLRCETCFRENTNKFYLMENGESVMDPFHSGQYAIFLYYLSKEVAQAGARNLADRLYMLNKMLNCMDAYHEINLPDVFYLEHPLATVLGRAQYGSYFVFQQGCTVGGNRQGKYPVLGEFVWLFANASVIGDSKVGNNVFIGAGATVKDEHVPDNSLVFGTTPNLVIKRRPEEYFLEKSPFHEHHRLLHDR